VSNALAIAAVTATLRAIVAQALPSEGFDSGASEATHVRPDANVGLPVANGVNLFLYRVSPNPHWRNTDLPTRRGTAVQRKPQIGLDLHYMLSFYGDDKELEPQRLLGFVTSALHANPNALHSTIASVKASLAFLKDSDLDQQAELVRITPAELSLEELTKLWSVFFQTKYVLSMAYTASIVLLEAEVPVAPPALPVATSKLMVRSTRDPQIDSIVPDTVSPTATASPTIQLRGQNLMLALDNPSLPAGSPKVPSKYLFAAGLGTLKPGSSNEEVAIEIPSGVAIGENWVRILNDGGDPTKVLAASNVVSFNLRPFLKSVLVLGGPTRIQADLLPAIGPTQPVRLVLVSDPPGTRLEIPVKTRETANRMIFDVSTAPPGIYRVLIDVDGQFTDRAGPITI
jgi:Pvc16 N-terminal domain